MTDRPPQEGQALLPLGPGNSGPHSGPQSGLAAGEPALLHDPGGKVRIRLPDGIVGEAEISPCQRYRSSLSRDWTPDGSPPRAILWIGMNPSTADAFVSDTTVAREEGFSTRWGYTRYLKANMLDWRATKPRDIPHDLVAARSEKNLPAILRMAEEAEIVVAAWGKLHGRYAPIVAETVEAIRGLERDVFCLGTNLDGSPKHPLYLRKTSELVPFEIPAG